MKNLIYSFTAGALFSLGFAPFSIKGLIYISTAWFFTLLVNGKSLRDCATKGFFYGLGKYGIGISWIYVSISSFSNAPFIFAIAITLLFIIFISIYELLLATIFHFFFKKKSSLKKVIGFAILASIFEWLRGHLFSGFPWLFISYSQIDTPISGLAPIIGSYGLSFITYLISCSLAQGLFVRTRNPSHSYSFLAAFIMPFLLLSPLLGINWTTPLKKNLSFQLVQGNVSHNDKWDSYNLEGIIQHYLSLSENAPKETVIVWPETAIPLPSNMAYPLLIKLQHLAMIRDQHFVFGLPGTNGDGSYSNSMMVIDKALNRYDKQHLVPFGEYLPFPILKPILNYFDIPLDDLKKGSKKQPLLTINQIKVAPFICFEVAYTDTLLKALPQANILLTITDDTWFGHSLAKAQHLEIAQMRSLQSGRAQAFTSNDGETAFIDNKGAIIKALPKYKAGIINGKLKAYSGLTPWSHLGDKLIISILMLLFFLLLSL